MGAGSRCWQDTELLPERINREHIFSHLERKCFLKINNAFLVFPCVFGLWLNSTNRKWMNSRMMKAPSGSPSPQGLSSPESLQPEAEGSVDETPITVNSSDSLRR